jgi:hypothetical protein
MTGYEMIGCVACDIAITLGCDVIVMPGVKVICEPIICDIGCVVLIVGWMARGADDAMIWVCGAAITCMGVALMTCCKIE